MYVLVADGFDRPPRPGRGGGPHAGDLLQIGIQTVPPEDAGDRRGADRPDPLRPEEATGGWKGPQNAHRRRRGRAVGSEADEQIGGERTDEEPGRGGREGSGSGVHGHRT